MSRFSEVFYSIVLNLKFIRDNTFLSVSSISASRLLVNFVLSVFYIIMSTFMKHAQKCSEGIQCNLFKNWPKFYRSFEQLCTKEAFIL